MVYTNNEIKDHFSCGHMFFSSVGDILFYFGFPLLTWNGLHPFKTAPDSIIPSLNH